MTDEIFKALSGADSKTTTKAKDDIFAQLSTPDAVSNTPEPMGNIWGQLLQGANWGFSDELGGAGTVIGGKLAGSDKSIPELYKGGRDKIRQENANYQRDNFWKSLLAQGFGALPTAIPAGGRYLATNFALSKAPALNNLIMGATGGAVAGYGGSEADTFGGDVANTLQGAGVGGAVGVAIPAVANKLISGASYLANAAKDAFTSPSTRANRVISEYLKDAGITSQEQLNAAASKIENPLLADVTESTRDLTDMMVQTPGPGRDIIKPKLEQRQQTGSQRIVSGLEDATGQKSGYYESVDAINAKMKELAAPLYKDFYDSKVPFTSDLQNIYKRDAIKKAFQEYAEIADAKGEKLPELFRFNNKTGKWDFTENIPDARGWDIIKRGLDALIDNSTDSITGKVSPKGQAYIDLKNELLGILDNLSPAYKDARKIWSSGSSIKTAMEQGKKILTTDDYLSSKAFNSMSDAEKQGYLLGAMNAIRSKLEMTSVNRDASLLQMFKAPEMQRRLRNAFPNEESFNNFMRIVKSEGKKAETNKVTQNSRTNTREQHQERLGIDTAGDAMGAARGDVGSVMRLVSNMAGNTRKLPPTVQQQIANTLMSPPSQIPASVFMQSQRPKYLDYLLSPQFDQMLGVGGKGLLSYSSGQNSSK